MNTDRFQVISPNDLSDYRDRAGDIAEASWPEFMLHDPIANENWHELFDRFSEYQFALLDKENGRMAAMGNSLPSIGMEMSPSCQNKAGIGSFSRQWRITRTASPRISNPLSRLPSTQIIKARD